MQPENVRAALEWLAYADNDLVAANRLLESPPALTGAAAFHCQQATEKALKGLLTGAGEHFAKTHDLGRLLKTCLPVAPELQRFEASVEELTPYVAEYRYPGGDADPEIATVREALELARTVIELIRARLVGTDSSEGEPEST